MPQGDGEKLNRVEELKNKLFSKNYRPKFGHRDTLAHTEGVTVPDSWAHEEKIVNNFTQKFFMKTSIFKNFFVFSLVFLCLTLAYATYMIFVGGNTVSNSNIDMTVVGNSFTAGGEELSLIIGITNRNNAALDLVDLIIEYPKNATKSTEVGEDTSLGVERLRESLGTIPAGAVRNENLKLILFGEQGSLIPIKISIEYRVEGSNAIFVKSVTHDVTLSSTPLNLEVEGPSSISPNQDITLKIKATLNATTPAPQILLKVDYPVGFQFISASPKPSLGNNAWLLGDLAPGVAHEVSLTGRMIDVLDGEEKTFRISSGSQSNSDKSNIAVVFNSIAEKVTIEKPFIQTALYINGEYKKEYAVGSNGRVEAEIHWTNNLDTEVHDLEITAKVYGNGLDRKSVQVEQGFYDSTDNVITWDGSSQNKFNQVDPGDTGEVKFSFAPVPLYSPLTGLLASPSIFVDISITGKQSQEGYSTEDLKNFESKTVKVISDVGFTGKATYSSGPFTNSGPVPPKAEVQTTYTITWTLSNSANTISQARIRSSLPSWVKFLGLVSPKEADLTYNASTHEVIWEIGSIPKGTSLTSGPKSVSFQIGFTPSLSQVGTVPVIVNDATLTGHDDFANVDVKASRNSIRTNLEAGDGPSGGGVVVD
jgi:hypothetical protein